MPATAIACLRLSMFSAPSHPALHACETGKAEGRGHVDVRLPAKQDKIRNFFIQKGLAQPERWVSDVVLHAPSSGTARSDQPRSGGHWQFSVSGRLRAAVEGVGHVNKNTKWRLLDAELERVLGNRSLLNQLVRMGWMRGPQCCSGAKVRFKGIGQNHGSACSGHAPALTVSGC